MTDAALDRLRAVNPIPTDPGAPPIEGVRARIAASEPGPAPRAARRRVTRTLGASLGAFAVVAVAAVVAGVVLLVHVGAHPKSLATVPTFTSGMRGTVSVSAAGLDGDVGYIWFERCTGCHGAHPGNVSYWLARTNDRGRSWTVTKRPELALGDGSGSGISAWAATVGDDPGGLTGGGIVVSHDRGGSWNVVHTAPSPNPYSVSVAGGQVWAVGDGCPGVCGGGILRGAVSGSRLTATPTTPRVGRRAVQIVALGTTSAYLYVPLGSGPAEAWVTDDAGRSWQRVAPGCPADAVSGGGSGAIWRSCRPHSGRSTIGISTDGGRRWAYHTAGVSTGILYPESSRTAWAQTRTGATIRTTDGARRWRTVWTPPSNVNPRLGTLSVQSGAAATETIPVTHTWGGVKRTNLILYRTADGGNHWQRTPVPLPSR